MEMLVAIMRQWVFLQGNCRLKKLKCVAVNTLQNYEFYINFQEGENWR